MPGSAIVVGGDFNCYDNPLDKFGGNASIHKEYDSLRNDVCLVDVWRKLHPNKCQFTWFNSFLSLGSRLDKLLIAKGLFSSESKCEISPPCQFIFVLSPFFAFRCRVSTFDFISFIRHRCSSIFDFRLPYFVWLCVCFHPFNFGGHAKVWLSSFVFQAFVSSIRYVSHAKVWLSAFV